MKKVIIKLSGSLARKFGREHERWLESGSVQEAVSALKNTLEGFTETFIEMNRDEVGVVVFKNRNSVKDEALLDTGGCSEVRIIPAVMGSKRGGLLGIFETGLFIAIKATKDSFRMFGKLMNFLTGTPKTPKLGDEDGNEASYGFGSAVSTVATGNNVPVLYGEREIGGAYGSASISNYDIPVSG